MEERKLKNLIIEVLRQEGKPVPLNALVDALIGEGFSREDIERAISELEKAEFIRRGRIRTLYGIEETIELIKEPEIGLEAFAIKEEITLTPSEARMLDTVKRVFGIEKPEIVEVDGTKTVIVEIGGERINIALGEIKRPELFEPIALEGKIWYAKKSPALERLKRKLKGEKEEEEVRRPTAKITEYGALTRYEKAKEAIEILKALRGLR
jgi:uncharacterized protein Smg (DUF494 family)